MVFEIYEEEGEEVTKLRLMYTSHGKIYLAAVDDEGEPLRDGAIASILPDGTLRLYRSIKYDLGFQLDREGRIKIEK